MAQIAQTDRLVLRRYVSSDAGDVVRLIGDYAVSQWLTSVPYPYTRQDALDFFAAHGASDRVCAVTYEGQLIGSASLSADLDLGYWYGVPFWGQGFASEAGAALLGVHFATSTDPVESGYLAGNTASRRVLEKLGFVETGQRNSYCMSRDCEVPNHRMVLRHQVWEARQ